MSELILDTKLEELKQQQEIYGQLTQITGPSLIKKSYVFIDNRLKEVMAEVATYALRNYAEEVGSHASTSSRTLNKGHTHILVDLRR